MTRRLHTFASSLDNFTTFKEAQSLSCVNILYVDIFVHTWSLTYCMLGRPIGVSQVSLSFSVAWRCSASPFAQQYSRPSFRYLSMFKQAVTSHHQQARKVETPLDGAGRTTPSWKPPAQTRLSSTTTAHTENVLGPVTDSKINRRDAQSSAGNLSVKRTSSGLVKAIGGTSQNSFEDDTQPAHVSSGMAGRQCWPSSTATKQVNVDFDEDDFDSDLDLEVEVPATKPSVSYPTLPAKQQSPPPQRKNITYPNLHKAQLHTHASRDSGYATGGNDEPPPSSVPIPWSSSPAEHTAPPARSHGLGKFAYHAEGEPRSNTHAGTRAAQPVAQTESAPKPSKRRTLPWLAQESRVEAQSPKRAKSGGSLGQSAPPIEPTKTPAPKKSETQYPWDASASAIKEQRKLRKESKKIAQESTTLPSDSAGIQTRKPTPIARLALSTEQRHILDLIVDQKKSVFFTGSAGTGKSVLLREIISVLRKRNAKQQDRVAITASTGLAACNIGGVTLHSFAGIGLGKEDVPELVKRVKRNQKAKHRWLRTSVLIVDEISMVDAELFDKLEAIARAIRNTPRPFGGIQVVITGDFFQLPPVPENGKMARFCFDAGAWATAIDHTIGLHHVFRQKDSTFADMLNEMREGKLKDSSVQTFHSLSRPLDEDSIYPSFAATELFSTRAEVDAANGSRMHQLQGTPIVFEARDGGTIVDKTQRDRLLANCMAPEVLELKKGAQVMLIKNIDEMLVNGSLGRIRGFMNEAQFDSYNADPDEFEMLQMAEDDAGLSKEQMKKRRLMHINAGSSSQAWPLVRFTLSDGNTRDLLCNRETWKIELPNGEVQASRAQVPLILAWALSIHKAQGQTLEKVKVDLGKVFEKGQAYVALSRATTMKGLQVLRFNREKVQAHPRVRDFYAELSRVGGEKSKEKKEGWEGVGLGKR